MTSIVTRSEQVAIDSIHPFENNARIGNIEVIKESLSRNGQYRGIVVNERTGEILAGNHTYKAAQSLGWSKIQVDFVDVDDQQARRIVAVDNRANDIAGYNEEALVELLQELDGDLEGTGYEKADLDELIAGLSIGFGGKDEDAVPDPPDEPQTELGQIIQLGDHFLICADINDYHFWVPQVEKLAPHGVNLTVTSPPYNIGLDKFKPSGMQKENPGWVNRMGDAYSDSKPEDEYQGEQITLLNQILELTADDGAMFYNHQVRYREKNMISPLFWLQKSDWKMRQEIIWNRGGGITLNARMFLPVEQRIYWLQRGMDNTFHDTAEIKSYSTIWDITPKVDIPMSAPFPVELPRRAIMACSNQGDIVFDPYSGTGTTLIAAHQQKRRFIGTEVNPAYCDVIIERFEKYTGIEVVR